MNTIVLKFIRKKMSDNYGHDPSRSKQRRNGRQGRGKTSRCTGRRIGGKRERQQSFAQITSVGNVLFKIVKLALVFIPITASIRKRISLSLDWNENIPIDITPPQKRIPQGGSGEVNAVHKK
jgi:hypothetical protein